MRIVVINGHPDPAPGHLCAALSEAYAGAARGAGHEVQRVDVGALNFPFVRSMDDYRISPTPSDLEPAQAAIRAADHLVLVFPIWFGSMPAYFKGFLEQIQRYGFALSSPQAATQGPLTGKSVRLIVTMGMPVGMFEWVLGAHGLKSLERGMLWVSGAGPIRHTLFGSSVDVQPERASEWLKMVADLGARGA